MKVGKCKCIRSIKFDSGEVFNIDKKYLYEMDGTDWINVIDNSGKIVKLLIDGTFKQVFKRIS